MAKKKTLKVEASASMAPEKKRKSRKKKVETPPEEKKIYPKDLPLNPRQAAFVREYLTNGYNGTQAAITAGYSESTARQTASENLTKPNIIEHIRIHELDHVRRFDVTRDELHQWLQMVMRYDPRDATDETIWRFSPRNLDDMPKSVRLAIAEFVRQEGEGGTSYKIKPYDKMAAFDRLMKHFGGADGKTGSESDSIESIDAALSERVSGFFQKRDKPGGENPPDNS